MEVIEGLMTPNVWRGLQIKKDKRIRNMTINVPKLTGKGFIKVIFRHIEEYRLPNEYTLLGNCTIDKEYYNFEYYARFGTRNATVISFVPSKVPTKIS